MGKQDVEALNYLPSFHCLFSVVVVTVYGASQVVKCLNALEKQVNAPPDMEVIVVCHENVRDVSLLQKQFHRAKFHRLLGRQTQDTLRAFGVSQAHGDLVAITVDHCDPDRHWCANIVKAHENPYAAVGGAIEKGTQPDTLVNRAIHLYDYCNYAYYQNPVHAGPARDLSDCNVSYKRRALEASACLWAEGFNVELINSALIASGETLWLSPDIVVHQNRSIEFGRAAHIAYRRGRAFASSRLAHSTRGQRIFYAAFSTCLPLMFWKRLTLNLYEKSLLGPSFKVLPLIGLLTLLWSLGEFIGYLTGQRGVTLAVSEE
jgi:hypothetical protein